VAIDDRARIGYTELYADECKAGAVQFLERTVAHFASLGERIRRVLTDNGSAFRSKAIARGCRHLNLEHSCTRPFRPQTNGKAERVIRSPLREWAAGASKTTSPNAPPCSRAGRTATTSTARTKASAASHP
jgi:transposase InsO family protein